ncbi:hypothetical protein Echvi_0526 [Echinicola vietnamensis DSM 17526]|uniref:Uncharacterized protein n=1 Tax=Echinicola vietnamensis (strain DSM 17526 / LMG 23754 / KMM 6221) TaxID=926556 RepID=L0FVW2_ECHVK|nr:hypothetical protein Echvi_0526 [Echinicola vietnamensis DSM 17526]
MTRKIPEGESRNKKHTKLKLIRAVREVIRM